MFKTTYNKNERIWSGNDILPLYNPRISLAQALLNSMSMFGPKVAQISDNNGICMTFEEIRMKTIRAAQNLQKLGLNPKQVIGILARNSHDVAPITFASIAIGCPVNALDPSFGKTELTHMLNITKPALIVCQLDCYEVLCSCLEELKSTAKIFTFGGVIGRSESVETLLKETHTENEFIPVQVDGTNETAMIVCSSGTTGLSKGVCESHAALLDANSRRSDLPNSSDVILCFSSLYWISGSGTLLTGTLCGATRIITTEVFSPELELYMIEKYKVTWSLNAPHQMVLMLKCDRLRQTDFSSLKYAMVGGSKVPFHVKTQMNQILPNGEVAVAYGMSEIGGIITYDYPITKDKDIVGRLCDGIRAKIIDEQGNRCGVNEDGEICLQTNYPFLGYFDNPEATAEVVDEEGFIRTGDLGHFDEDGDLYNTGRKKDLLKYCNYQISPVEIDAYLMESPKIKSACVVGIPYLIATDLPAAAIVRAEGSRITEKEVADLVAGHFSDHCKLRGGVYFVDLIPTTPCGKVLRRVVKEMVISSLYSGEE